MFLIYALPKLIAVILFGGFARLTPWFNLFYTFSV